MIRRPLAETMIDLVSAAAPVGEAEPILRITSLAIDVPIEVRLRRIAGELELLADVPSWRWQTGMEEPRSCLKICWEEEET
ncbi:MAG: hypothetical protein ACRENG_09780 [bacterium]